MDQAAANPQCNFIAMEATVAPSFYLLCCTILPAAMSPHCHTLPHDLRHPQVRPLRAWLGSLTKECALTLLIAAEKRTCAVHTAPRGRRWRRQCVAVHVGIGPACGVSGCTMNRRMGSW